MLIDKVILKIFYRKRITLTVREKIFKITLLIRSVGLYSRFNYRI
jgi:hypothetical protein